MKQIALNIVSTGMSVKLSKYPIFQAKIEVFLSCLSTCGADTVMISVYSHSYKTIEEVYGLQNLNFPYFCKNLKLLEDWYVGSTYPP